MGTLIASLSTLPPSVWYDAAAVTFGIVLGIMAILRRRLRWIGAAVLIVTVAAALYVTYHEVALAALVTWMPAFVALLVGFLLVARGYHNKTWEKTDNNAARTTRPALPEPAEKAGRFKGKIDLHIRDRIRRNLAGEDLRSAIEEPRPVQPLIPAPPEPGAPIFPVPEPTAPASVAMAVPFVPATDGERPMPEIDAAPGDLLGVWAQGPAQRDAHTLHHQVVNLALKFASPDEVDVPSGQNAEALAELAQSIVNYLADVAPEHLLTAPIPPSASPVPDLMADENVSAPGLAGTDVRADSADTPDDEPTPPVREEMPAGVAAAPGVEDPVDHAVNLLAQKLGDAVYAFGQELRLGLAAANKSGN